MLVSKQVGKHISWFGDKLVIKLVGNGKESTVNRALGGSTYPS
jgi:hypothetical protein